MKWGPYKIEMLSYRDIGVTVDAIVEENLMHLLVTLLDVAAIAETPHVRIKKQDELEANVIGAVELESGQLGRDLLEGVEHGGYAEQRERQQLELLSVGQRRLVGQVVVHALVNLVQNQHLGPGILQQFHLVVHLQGKIIVVISTTYIFSCPLHRWETRNGLRSVGRSVRRWGNLFFFLSGTKSQLLTLGRPEVNEASCDCNNVTLCTYVGRQSRPREKSRSTNRPTVRWFRIPFYNSW